MGLGHSGNTLQPSVSALVVTYNSERFIQQCLQALQDSMYPISQIAVVDNASADNSVHVVESNFPAVQVIRSPRNLGFAGGCNLGFPHLSGQIIALVNPDVVVRPSWLGELVKVIVEDASVAIAGGKLLYEDGRTIQHAGAFSLYPLALSDHCGYGQLDDGRWDEQREVDYVTGAALAIRREPLDHLGGFDEMFFPAYYEEADLCLRARKAGWKVVYVPSAVGIHYEATSVGKYSYAHYYYFHLNRLRFVLKNYSMDQLLSDFFPAERDYLESILPEVEIRALCRAYADTLDYLHSQQAPAPDRTTSETEEVLFRQVDQLRRRADQISHAKSLGTTLFDVNSEINAIRLIPEPTFHSDVPVIGSLIACFRAAWNWVSTKWYVRQILQEQNEVNLRLVRCLNEMARQLAELQHRIDTMDRNESENSILQPTRTEDK